MLVAAPRVAGCLLGSSTRCVPRRLLRTGVRGGGSCLLPGTPSIAWGLTPTVVGGYLLASRLRWVGSLLLLPPTGRLRLLLADLLRVLSASLNTPSRLPVSLLFAGLSHTPLGLLALSLVLVLRLYAPGRLAVISLNTPALLGLRLVRLGLLSPARLALCLVMAYLLGRAVLRRVGRGGLLLFAKLDAPDRLALRLLVAGLYAPRLLALSLLHAHGLLAVGLLHARGLLAVSLLRVHGLRALGLLRVYGRLDLRGFVVLLVQAPPLLGLGLRVTGLHTRTLLTLRVLGGLHIRRLLALWLVFRQLHGPHLLLALGLGAPGWVALRLVRAGVRACGLLRPAVRLVQVYALGVRGLVCCGVGRLCAPELLCLLGVGLVLGFGAARVFGPAHGGPALRPGRAGSGGGGCGGS
jgi:hypothetical protein